ncbi:claspin [Formica exsecta]|uniref:claspin n=1 Tax=Formica exsecta TaxID=72781 RepID=UPI0011447145|nr:claspin [Formica exsecta]
MEVSSSNKDFNEKEHFINNSESNISNDIPRCNDEKGAHNRKDEKNVEENLENIACDSVSINNSYLDNESDHNKPGDSKKNELRASDKYCNEDNNINNTKKLLSKRFLNLVDSDSENESTLYETLTKTYSPNENDEHLNIAKYKKNLKNKNARMESEYEDDTQMSKINNFSQTVDKTINITTSGYQSLIDSESEEEEGETQDSVVAFEKFNISEDKSSKKEFVKKRKGSIRASKDDAMRQIHSETQRLLRETEISLPYHKPKQRTLQEFLNRKKILASLPKAPTTVAKLKMSSAIVSQVVAEKEREAEFFYKSSDSEDDTQQSISFAARDIKKSSITYKKMPLTDVKNMCIQNSQKIDTSNQAIHNEGKIVQDHIYLNTSMVSEKDFSKVDYQNKESSFITENSSNHDDESNTLLQQIDNEDKQNHQKCNVSRKLFDTCFGSKTNEDSDLDSNKQETEGIVKTIITSLEKEKYINYKKKSEISMTENHISEISQVYQCDSEAINIDRNKNLIAETKILEIPNDISNKEIAETLQRDNYKIDNIVTFVNSDDFIIIQDENDKKKDKYDKTDISPSIILTDDTPSKYENNSLTEECKDSDNHALGLPFSKFVDETLIDRKKLLPKLVPNSIVTLKGSPGMIIDLTNNVKSYGKGVNTLLDRFFCKHVINAKRQANDKSQETMVDLQNTPNSPLLIKELLPYNLPTNTDNPELSKPGAKLIRLKEDLKLQMTIKRNEEWKHKKIELQEKEKWDEEEESDYDSNGQEKIPNFESSDSGESELEEDDICIKDKKRSKCLLVDDEVEVTDNEDSSTDAEETYSKNDVVQAKYNNKQSANLKCREEHMDDSTSEIETEQEEDVIDSDTDIENRSEYDSKENDNNICKNFDIIKNKKDKTKQLIEEFQGDLNITNPIYPENDNKQLKNVLKDVNMYGIQYEDNDLISENKSNMPANQKDAEVITRSQINKTPSTKTSMLDFVSPITQLSVLNTTLDSPKNKKDTLEDKEYLFDADEKSIFMENTQSDRSSEYAQNIGNKNILRKKLFDDTKETVDDEYLMRLCSGKFDSTQKTDLDLSLQTTNSKSRLCPENWNTKLIDIKELKSLEIEDKNSQDVKLILDEDSNNSVNHMSKMEQVGEIVSELKLTIVSSDDDDQLDETDTFLKPRKRSVKRLHLSDSEEENAQSSDEENDGMDKETEEQYIDYDSEENEVVPEKDIKKVAADFLDEEAELSESDWDSADEDEKDLDKLEYEEADDEHIDEHEMKNQLEKIHRTYMRQVLNEDKKEVRLLQELLFEDGDLHTNGISRERKFKWRNIDKLESNNEMSQASDEKDGWIDVQEEEEEAKWSKLRQERDKFLEDRMKCSNNEIEDELCNSQIFKFGLEALKKIKNDESQELYASDNKIDSSENMEPIMPRNITDLLNRPNTGKKSQTIYNVIKKRSLLTRGEESLAKIASLAKQGESASHTINARNFVFQYINLNNTSEKNDKIREEDEDSQGKPQKRRATSNFSLTTKKRRK